MYFDSAFFIFCFFPVLFLICLPVRSAGARNSILLVAGLIFYSFGCLFDLAVLLVMASVTYLAGLCIRRELRPRLTMAAAVVFNIAVLAAFKLIERLTVTVTGPDGALRLLFARVSPVTLAAPLGVSFFAFKCVSYIVDAYRDRESSTGSFWKFLLYVSFFPELVSGPISRFRDFAPQLAERRAGLEETVSGLCRFIRGLAKKLILAGAAGAVADGVFGFEGVMDARLAWAGAVAYSLQIFFDFSGYSDMAVGLAGVFGFTSPENFNYPYASVSITDFWRRWHMSLSHWFRDYVYIPLGGNRRGERRTAVNKFIVFALCGLWHGFGLTFLIWGAWHGLLAALESMRVIDIQKLRERKWGGALSRVYTLLAVCLGFVMFRAPDAARGFRIIGAMFTGFHWTAAGTALVFRLLNARNLALLALGGALSVPTAKMLAGRVNARWAPAIGLVLHAALFALCIMELAAGNFSPFIYAQF